MGEKPFNQATRLLAPCSQRWWSSKAITETAACDHANKQISIRENAAVPTSLRQQDLQPENNDLANFKVQIDNQDGLICITCGGIDSKKKADEFMAGLLQTLQMRFERHQNKELKSLRISLNQLNSYWTDGQLVAKEHSQSHYIRKAAKSTISWKQKSTAWVWTGALPLVAHSNNASIAPPCCMAKMHLQTF